MIGFVDWIRKQMIFLCLKSQQLTNYHSMCKFFPWYIKCKLIAQFRHTDCVMLWACTCGISHCHKHPRRYFFKFMVLIILILHRTLVLNLQQRIKLDTVECVHENWNLKSRKLSRICSKFYTQKWQQSLHLQGKYLT